MILTLVSGNNNDDVDPNDNESESCLQAMTMMMKIVTQILNDNCGRQAADEMQSCSASLVLKYMQVLCACMSVPTLELFKST